MMTLPENLTSLHVHEEEIRAGSLKIITSNDALRDHVSMIHGSLALIYALAHDHQNNNEDELTIQYLGLRLFNSGAASLKLGLSGYYQAAFALVRDVFETVALLDYLNTNRDQITVWKASDKKERITKFGPGPIRNKLNERDQLSGNKRKEIYDLLSEYASHATAPGFQLLAPQGLAQIGPFLNEKYLRAWVEDMVKHVTHGATIFDRFFDDVEVPLFAEKRVFLEQFKSWHKVYFGRQDGPVAT